MIRINFVRLLTIVWEKCMNVRIESIERDEDEQVLIKCHNVDSDIMDIINFIQSKHEIITGYNNLQIYQLYLREIYYFEGVDNKVYAYLKDNIYEIKKKLYELEEIYEKRQFFRCSKSVLINLLKIESVKPTMNGRFTAKLFNGEQIIISRQYVPKLKRIMQI